MMEVVEMSDEDDVRHRRGFHYVKQKNVTVIVENVRRPLVGS